MQTKFNEPWQAKDWRIGCETDGGFEIVAWSASNNARRTEKHQRRIDRAVDCVNAMAGVPDPAAFMAVVDALVEACERQIEAFKTTMKMIGEEWEPENLKSDSFISVLPKTIKAVRSARGKH